MCNLLQVVRTPMPKLIGINQRGNRVGEDHAGAKLTDHEVALLFELHEEGWGYRRLARHFEMSKSHVRAILKGTKRAQSPARFKAAMPPTPRRRAGPTPQRSAFAVAGPIKVRGYGGDGGVLTAAFISIARGRKKARIKGGD